MPSLRHRFTSGFSKLDFRQPPALVASCIVVICALAWAYLVRLGSQMSAMATMGMTINAPWRGADFVLTFVMWAVMMVGMMGTTAAPVLLVFASSHARRAERDAPSPVLPFALGYLTIWLGFSAVATLAQFALKHAALLTPAMAVATPRLAGLLLFAAGAYQLTPVKRACLEHCQTPMSFLMTHWRDGRSGAFHMGLRHGLYCLGCCWALMAVLFAVGVMNLAWVAALTVFILAERVGRTGAIVSRVGGAVMVGLGIVAIAG